VNLFYCNDGQCSRDPDILHLSCTVKKRLAIFPPPARESLVSDIPAGDGKMANHFYGVVLDISGRNPDSLFTIPMLFRLRDPDIHNTSLSLVLCGALTIRMIFFLSQC
jgi:hypothetical protein